MNIQAPYIRILLLEANAVSSPLDIAPLTSLFEACIKGDLPALEKFTEHPRAHVRSAASFILRKHNFATSKALSEKNHVS